MMNHAVVKEAFAILGPGSPSHYCPLLVHGRTFAPSDLWACLLLHHHTQGLVHSTRRVADLPLSYFGNLL